MELTTELSDLRKMKPLPQIPSHRQLFMDNHLNMEQLYYTTDPSLHHANIPYSLDVLAQMAQYTEPLVKHAQSKDIPLLPMDADSITGELFSVSETYFQPSPASSKIPSPWSMSSSKRSREEIERISTGSVPTLSVTLSQATNEVECSKADIHSLAQIRLNIKLYRRMASKTRDQETQMAYAKYLLSMAKACPVESKDTQEALVAEVGYWIQRLTKVGCPEALFIKAQWYLLGPQAEFARGHEQVQENKAIRYFKRASKAGWAEANYELAQVWKRRGCYQKAIQYYERGAKGNHTPSIYKMAKIMLRGQLKSTKNLEKGLEYLQRAADMKDSESAEAAFVLGCIYANDLERVGIQKDISFVYEDINKSAKDNLAFRYLKKSFKDGYPDAIHYMGQILEIGMLGQDCDVWQGYQYYAQAAKFNHAGAMLDLSRIYFQGIPGLLPPQKENAFKWCKKSADLGFDQAEYVLRTYYKDNIDDISREMNSRNESRNLAEKKSRGITETQNRMTNDTIISFESNSEADSDDTKRGKSLKKGAVCPIQ